MTEQEWLESTDPAKMLQQVTDGREPFPPRVSARKLRLFAVACCRSVWEHIDEEYPRRCVVAAESFADGGRTKTLVARAGSKYESGGAITLSRNRIGLATCLDDAAIAAVQTSREHTMLDNVYGDQAIARRVQANLLRDIVGNPFRPVVLPPGPVCLLCGDSPVKGKLTPDGMGLNWVPCAMCNGTGHHPCPWLTDTVLSLAQAAYDERDPAGFLEPDRLAVLSDALEEVGCPSEVYAAVICQWCGGSGEVDFGPKTGPAYGLEPKYIFKPDSGRIACSCRGKKQFRKMPHPLLAALRSEGPHVRGFWSPDLLLGKF